MRLLLLRLCAPSASPRRTLCRAFRSTALQHQHRSEVMRLRRCRPAGWHALRARLGAAAGFGCRAAGCRVPREARAAQHLKLQACASSTSRQHQHPRRRQHAQRQSGSLTRARSRNRAPALARLAHPAVHPCLGAAACFCACACAATVRSRHGRGRSREVVLHAVAAQCRFGRVLLPLSTLTREVLRLHSAGLRGRRVGRPMCRAGACRPHPTEATAICRGMGSHRHKWRAAGHRKCMAGNKAAFWRVQSAALCWCWQLQGPYL